MKLIYKLIIILFLFTLFSCSKDIKSISEITEVNQELELVNTYQDGMNALEEGDYFFASEKFLESELLFPQSIWAPKSVLMAAYSLYMLDNYSDAKFNLERYINTYPKDKNMAYAYYLLGMVYYETIVDQTRDQEPLLNSKKQFELVISRFKDTEFALDSKFKLDMINDILASKEMYVGRHYIKSKKWIAAINRFKTVIKEYETTIYVEEAIHRLVEIHYHIGLTKEAEKYANLLGYNYLSSGWYKKSYKLFNKDYKILNLKKNNKKEKNTLTNFFKKLFE